MADEKKDSGEEQEKKGGLMKPLMMVAVGAMLGAAGVVFTSGKGEDHGDGQHEAEHQEVEKKKFELPDVMEFSFQPRTDSGKQSAVMHLRVVYEVEDDAELQQEAREYAKLYWNQAYAACLRILRESHADDFQGEAQALLLAELRDELSYVLFPIKGDKRIATVIDVLITQFFWA